MRNKDEHYARLVHVIHELQEDILERLQPHVVGSIPAMVNVRSLSRSTTIHAVAAVEIGRNGTALRCFAKGDVANYQGPQRLETEDHILRHVAPEIWKANPRTRCPQVLAFFPHHKLLLLEMVDGKSLKELLFDVGATRSDIPDLLALAGEWLGRFHAITRGEQADPFAWVKSAFAGKKVRDAFQECAVSELYSPLEGLLQRFAREYPDFRRPLYQLHAEFTPLHVLVKDDAIYVIDFGSSRRGFGYEDVALFTSFFDSLLPWRAVAGFLRLPLAQQKRTFMESYLMHCEETFGSPDQIVMSFARLHAMAHYVSCREPIPFAWPTALYAQIGRLWVRRQFAALARRELAFLQQMASVPPVWCLDYASAATPYSESVTSDSSKLK
jgi:tRNA A-37 threonylcarbamoyl transferase component Bud32